MVRPYALVLVCACVYAEAHRDEMFTAIKGHGAFLNGAPMGVSTVGSLGDAVIAWESSHRRA